MDRTAEYIKYNELYDVYGNLLNEREKEIFKLYYEEDFSLQEIASERNVSKSAIGNAIKIINQKLDAYEEKLQMAMKMKQLQSLFEKINDPVLKDKIKAIIELNNE